MAKSMMPWSSVRLYQGLMTILAVASGHCILEFLGWVVRLGYYVLMSIAETLRRISVRIQGSLNS